MHAEANPLGLSYINTYLQGSWKNEKKERGYTSAKSKKEFRNIRIAASPHRKKYRKIWKMATPLSPRQQKRNN
jgi:hypothetical protein